MDWPTSISISRIWKSFWALSKRVKTLAVAVVVFVVVAFSIFITIGRRQSVGNKSNGCDFPAIFNFGDSNSDTGGNSAAFHRIPSPNGVIFFHKPSGRYCDGKVLIDFTAEKLGLPYLSAYLDSIGSYFQHGSNFATGGSTIQSLDTRIFEGGFSPISLDIQLMQFEQLKARTEELYDEGGSSSIKSRLPRPEDFSKALYTLDIGQNDLSAGFKSMTEKQVVASIPKIINLLAQAVEQLYQHGARAFWIHNTGPVGCLPHDVIYYPPKPENMDANGCIKSRNEVAQEFNMRLKERVYQLRVQFPDAILTYVDIYSAKYSLISEAKKHGFVDPLEFCCGHFGDYRVPCWNKGRVNGTDVFPASCSNPSVYISWDGIHYSHAANQWVANQILDGFLSDPPTPIIEACHKPVHI